ncbi:MAG: glycerol kinase GlpK [Agarilytica sp.]
MSKTPLILAIDQGTTSSRAIVFDRDTNIVAVAQKEFKQYYPQSGWVEHDPEEIWSSTIEVCRAAINDAEEKYKDKNGEVVAIGITNQRETSIVWNRHTGMPIHNAIVWQDRRTADVCAKLKAAGHERIVQEKTGLLLDPYFSASKVAWMLDHVDGAREAANRGQLAFGTVDSFLLARLTKGNVHATDATNASRTSLYNIQKGAWDQELLAMFNVPDTVLPEVKDCASDFGVTDAEWFGREIPILGVAGDQQAAAIGQTCFSVGDTKSTYGTGCFALMNIGELFVVSKSRLLTTIAYQLDGKTTYALEGSIFIAGAAIQWLRDELQLISDASETEVIAEGINSTQGVYLVPAFTGLGAPYWEPDARGAIVGLSRGSGKKEIVRAALESVCYQTYDLTSAMAADANVPSRIRVDGGMVANNWVLSFLADILELDIDRPKIIETTALGAAFLAGLQAGVYKNLEDVTLTWKLDQRFEASMGSEQRTDLLQGWKAAINKVLV